SFDPHEITGAETRALFIERLNGLPIDLLADHPNAVASLGKTGFKTFGDLAIQLKEKSSAGFRKRLGADFTEMLGELYSLECSIGQGALFEKPRDNYQPDEWFEKAIQFE